MGTNGEGPEFETMARVRLRLGPPVYFTFGTGVSLAHYTGHDHNGLDSRGLLSDFTSEHTTSYAVWRHAIFWSNELGLEMLTRHRVLRGYLGYPSILNARATPARQAIAHATPLPQAPWSTWVSP